MTDAQYSAALRAITTEFDAQCARELAQLNYALAQSRAQLRAELDALFDRDITLDIPGA